MNVNDRTDVENITVAINGYSIGTTIHISCQVVLFLIGTFIQIKIISVCRKEKGATWKIHVAHSVVLMINFAFNISFDTLIFFVPLVSHYTGKWLCYLASLVTYYCFYSIVANSLIISIMKYIFIVHQIPPSGDKGVKIKTMFFFVHLLYPLILTSCHIVASDWTSFSSMKKCFDESSEKIANPINDAYNMVEEEDKTLFCFFKILETKQVDIDMYLIGRYVFCILRTFFNLAVNSNLLESFFYYKIFHRMQIQVRPSSGNVAPECLSEGIRNRNIRKVETNARVTFVVWILEICANVCIIIVWAFVYGKTTFGTLTTNIVWYYLILPHIFLMNTSHNKDLIVENGWKATIKNALSLPISFRRNNLIQNIKQNINLDTSKKDDATRIAIISDSRICYNDKVESELPNFSEIQEHEVASSSYVTDTSSNTIRGPILTRSSSSETNSDEKIDHTLGYRVYFGEQILERMVNSIMHENTYLHYFHELLRLEEVLRMNGQVGEEFKIIEYSQTTYVKIGKSKSSSSKEGKKSFAYNNKNNQFNDKSKKRHHECFEKKIEFAVSQTKRINLRRETLKDFHTFCINEEAYNDFVEILISLEEDIVI